MAEERKPVKDVVLRPASQAQWLKTQDDEALYPEWSRGLSLENFHARERWLNQELPFGKHAFRRWILVPSNDPNTLDYFCACESYLRPIAIKGAKGDVEENTCHTIAAVFTPPQHRRLGYASRMMVLLHEALSQDSVLSVLYSDVVEFYERARRAHPDPSKAKGWQIVDPYHVIWPVASEADIGTDNSTGYKVVKDTNFERIAARDAALLKRELATATGGSAFVILPEGGQLDWLVGRAKYHDNPEYTPSRSEYPRLANFGCEKSPENDECWSFAIWTFDFVGKQLDILRLRAHTPQEMEEIVRLAKNAAAEQGMTKVTAWNVDPRLFPEGSGWTNEAREEHLPAIAWYGEGEAPMWRHVEHYSWC